MLSQGITAMVVGMLVVFGFLILLVYAMKLMSFVITRWFPEPEKPAQPVRKKASADAEVAAAIAAVTAYKQSN